MAECINVTEQNVKDLKQKCFEGVAAHRRDLCAKPDLKFLFFELTSQCNEYCKHCGSRCNDIHNLNMLSTAEWKSVLDQVKEDFDLNSFTLAVTGGEPLLRPDFFEIMGYAHKLGYKWGMTTNGTLITPEVAKKLKEVGLATISISLENLD